LTKFVALLLAALLVAVAAHAQTGVVSGASVTATGSSAARSLADRFSQVINVKDYGAKGDGTTDDSAAFVAAINKENSYQAAGTPAVVYVPGGKYFVSANTLPTMTHGGAVIGDSTHKTYILVGTSYSGDVFSWSESWVASNYGGPTLNPANDNAGPALRHISIVGNTGATNVQNAIMFYDRNDLASVDDVDVFFMHGQCLGIGATKNQPQGYMRESAISDLDCWFAGLTNVPAVSVSSTTQSGSDATNEVKFFRLQIFDAPGVGLSITNPNNFSATRLLEFFAPRVEYSAADNIQVGSSTDAGQVANINFFGLESITPGQANSGFYALNLDTAGQNEYGINVLGATIGPCWTGTCKGINVGNIRSSRLQINSITTTGTNVTYGTTTNSGVVIDGNGAEQNWTYSYAGSTYKNYVQSPIYRSGDPTSTANTVTATPSLSAMYHDNTSTFGNTVGPGGVDLQIVRSSATHAATGNISALVGGSYNVASGTGSSVMGGFGNTVSGSYGHIGGGKAATDRGRDYTQAFAGGSISATGDAQASHFVLSATCASCSSQRLAASHGTPSTTNIANISNTQSYAMSWRCVARDTTTAGTDNATTMPVMLMTRDANAASTAVSLGTPATATRGTWTGGGFAFTADTTNGGVNIAFTSPTGNTDTFHAVCEGHDAETQ
jgi:hypothetical protein